MRSFAMVMVAAVLAGMLGGCGAGAYEEKFSVAQAMPIPAEDPIVGAWEGTWEDADGHSGQLKAIVTPARTAANVYDVEFHATYFNDWFDHVSVVTLTGKRIGNKVVFEGEKDLGSMAGGVYRYTGHITPAYFHADYTTDSNKYRGIYELRRPEGVVPIVTR
jgi:hypothetical protein